MIVSSGNLKVLLGLGMTLMVESFGCLQQHDKNKDPNQRQEVTNILKTVGLPAGTVRALVIFVQFQDDTFKIANSEWPCGQLPQWSSRLISSAAGNYPESSVSQFYDRASAGKHHLIGDIYPKLIVTQHSDTWYLSNKKTLKEISREVLQAVDADVDFSKYDNWTKDGSYWNYFVKPEPDGLVDMVFAIYRRVSIDNPAQLKFLGSGNADLWIDSLATDDGVVISGKSGVTQHEGAEYSYDWIWETATHEYAHYLFGEHENFPKFIPSHTLKDKPRYRL